MRKRKLMIAAAVVLTAGAVAAISAPGPRGERGWGMGHGFGGDGFEGAGEPRGWFGPRSITADEYDARTRERFARLDKNGDGVIDAAEIEAAMSARRAGWRDRMRGRDQAGPGSRGDEFLRRFGDKDGKVTKDAFLAEAKRRFQQMDLNNDGKVTDDDLPPMMRGKGVLKAGEAMPMLGSGAGPRGGQAGPMGRMIGDLRQADVKGDGVITLDAYLALQTKRFVELDRNKDNVVDKADFELMRKDMTDYMVKRFIHAHGADATGKITKDQFYATAKERFARLDRKGEGRITLGPPDGGRGELGPGRWFGRDRGGDDAGPGGPGGRRGPDGPPPPKN